MFDLEKIENDWKKNSFKLSEEEIIKIYESEHVSLSEYEKLYKKYHIKESAEERLLRMIFGEENEENKKEEKLIKIYESIRKNRLSKEKQKIVVEGSLWLVFDQTHYWYKFFEEKICIEKIYYVCLEALMNSVKYLVHIGKPIFRFYVCESIRRNITKYVSKSKKITYREANEAIYLMRGSNINNYEENLKVSSILSNYEKETIEKPSKIYYRLKDEYYDVDYTKNTSSLEFMKDYKIALKNLNDEEREVMQMSYDINGFSGLTYAEIAEYLGTNKKEVSNIKRRAIKKLRKNIIFNKYLNK